MTLWFRCLISRNAINFMQKHIIKTAFFVFFSILCTFSSFGQRKAIDKIANQARVSFEDPEALRLARKFIQMDSTYYMGYYYEGAYRYYRSADERGYKSAIKPLKKALALLEKDYGWRIVRYTDRRLMFDAFEIQRQYCSIINLLQTSYRNIERPAEAVELLHQYKDKLLVVEFAGSPYANLAWIYHRNRMSFENYDFLKPSIEENVSQADLFLDSISGVNNRNIPHLKRMLRNPDEIFKDLYNSIYHYKQIIHSYRLNIDSAEYYSEKMRGVDRLSYNNYGNFQFVKGDFKKATENYKLAKENKSDDKRFREFDYMQSAIHNFRGEPDKGAKLIKNTLEEVGPTPGYGWYNLGLARSYYYLGDLTKSKLHQNRASKFEELHIGTTHGEVMYERSNMVLNYLNLTREMKKIMLEDRYFWLSIKKVFRLVKMYLERKSLHLLIASQLSADPEREMVTYNIFASENLVFYDEIWPLIKDFNASFFINKFSTKIEEDQRDRVKKYFHYYIGRFHHQEDDLEEAKTHLNLVLADTSLDAINERLLIARTQEALAMVYDEADEEEAKDQAMMEMLKAYPQLVPFSEVAAKLHLKVNHNQSERLANIEANMADMNFDWQDSEDDARYPTISINLEEEEENIKVKLKMMRNGNVVMNKTLLFKDFEKNIHQKIIYTIFEIGDKKKEIQEEEKPAA